MPPLLDEDEGSAPLLPPTNGSPRGLAGLLTFMQPQQPAAGEQLIPSPTSLPDEATPPHPFAPAGSPSGSDEPHDEMPPALEDTSSTTSGTPAGRKAAGPNPFASANLKRTARNAVLIAGDQANRFLARTEGQVRAGLYRTDEDDAEKIGDPLAGIIGRREGLGGKISEDGADAIAAAMGLANYFTKQMVLAQAARQFDAGPQAAAPTDGPVDY